MRRSKERYEASIETDLSAQAAIVTSKAKVAAAEAKIDAAEADVMEAESEVRVAQAEFTKAEVQVAFATITAPFDDRLADLAIPELGVLETIAGDEDLAVAAPCQAAHELGGLAHAPILADVASTKPNRHCRK